MTVIGDLTTADKFVVFKDDNSIEWVTSLSDAESLIKNPNSNWYNRNIHATNEKVVKGLDNKVYLISKLPTFSSSAYELPSLYEDFIKQTKEYINVSLNKYLESINFSSFEEVTSWYNSSIKEMKELAKKSIKVRDLIYSYHLKFIQENTLEKLKAEGKEYLEVMYKSYIENFPDIKL